MRDLVSNRVDVSQTSTVLTNTIAVGSQVTVESGPIMRTTASEVTSEENINAVQLGNVAENEVIRKKLLTRKLSRNS